MTKALDPKMIKDLSLGIRCLVLGCDIKTSLKRKTTICSFLYFSIMKMPLCVELEEWGVVCILNKARTKQTSSLKM